MKLHAALILTTLLACSASAFAQTINISVTNGDNQDLYVAVIDQNQSGQVAYNSRINQGDSRNVPITPDGSGNGSITWRIVLTDTTRTPPEGYCGQVSGLGAGSGVTVSHLGASLCGP